MMQLYITPGSPYARMARIVVIEKGLQNRVEIISARTRVADSPYYEKAMMMRSRENTIYFASVNYALRFQESATSLIDPSGECQAYLPYGQEGVLIQTIRPEEATGFLALRYATDRYQEFKE